MATQAAEPVADVSGRHLLVIGGTRGIGRALCARLVGLGARVTLTGRNQQDADRVADELNGTDPAGAALGLALEAKAPEPVLAHWLAQQPEPPAALVYNAGISPIYTRADRITREQWEEIQAVNVTGAFLCATAYARALIDARVGGAVVLVSSVAGLVGDQRLSAYGASKSALLGLTRHLAADWATLGIRVNAVAPGWVATDLTQGLRENPALQERLVAAVPMGHMATPEEIADPIVFLASDSARYVTGAVYTVDGGLTAC